MQDPRDIHVSDYTYDLPQDRIAVFPLAKRDDSKLLVYNHGEITDANFKDIVKYLPSGARLVFNESSVINARLLFRNAKDQQIEVFCLEPYLQEQQHSPGIAHWLCMVGRLKRWKEGSLNLIGANVTLEAVRLESFDQRSLIEFRWSPQTLTFEEVLQQLGQLPIPPYLNRETESIDQERYQTVYARDAGSVAAPTAGLHFTESTFKALSEAGIPCSYLSLHVGTGTFKPVKARLARHDMHAEWLWAPRSLIEAMAHESDKVIAVGTTSLRAMESLYWLGVQIASGGSGLNNDWSVGQWEPYDTHTTMSRVESMNQLLEWMDRTGHKEIRCRSSILIAPPYRMRVVEGLVTNFHQPSSTLLMLVAALLGDEWRKIYAHALKGNYRFLSYGDSSLLLS